MEGKVVLTVLLILATDFALDPRIAFALPIDITEETVVVSSGDVVTEVVSSGDTGSGVTQDLRERSSAVELLHTGGCLDNAGILHVTGSSWNIGCNQTCDCISTPEGPIQHCSSPRCAIPMLSPGCQLVPNPRRNDTTGENCCDVVDCKPVYCVDSKGGKHEVYTSWIDGELDCFCQHNFKLDTVEPSCVLLQTEIPPSQPPVPSDLHLSPENHGWERELPLNETNETFNGCLDNAGILHVTGSSWNIGCNQTCDCISTPEGPIQHCSSPRCAIPMLSPGCQLVPNPRRNDTTGENCCDVVDCKPVYCVDSKGGKHEVYTSWIDGDLDCFCQHNFKLDTVEPSCVLLQPEIPPSPPPVPSDLQLSPENLGWERELLLNETNETFNVCKAGEENTYTIGEKWRVGCETECTCVQTGEIPSADCTPIPCPVPALLPGCTVVPNPDRDTVNSLNCCDKVVCPPHLCIGQDRLLHKLNSIWYESGQTCTCSLNYNVNQAFKECGMAEEIQNSNQL